MKSVFHKENLLSYVDKKYDYVPQQLPSTTEASAGRKSNGWAVVAVIVTSISIFTFWMVIPTVFAVAFSVVALITAFRNKGPKVLSVLCLVGSVVLFGLGLVTSAWLIGKYDSPENVRIPANYSIDESTGVGYKYVPITQIPCDSNGNCPLTVDLIASENKCDAGGVLYQEVFSTTTGEVYSQQKEFSGIKLEEKTSIELVYQSSPGDILMLVNSPYIQCN